MWNWWWPWTCPTFRNWQLLVVWVGFINLYVSHREVHIDNVGFTYSISLLGTMCVGWSLGSWLGVWVSVFPFGCLCMIPPQMLESDVKVDVVFNLVEHCDAQVSHCFPQRRLFVDWEKNSRSFLAGKDDPPFFSVHVSRGMMQARFLEGTSDLFEVNLKLSPSLCLPLDLSSWRWSRR